MANGLGTPDFSDAIPPRPANQGDMGPEGLGHNRTDCHEFAGGAPVATAADESDWQPLVDVTGLEGSAGREGADIPSGVRGYRPSPIGGTAHPNGTSNTTGVERSAMAG